MNLLVFQIIILHYLSNKVTSLEFLVREGHYSAIKDSLYFAVGTGLNDIIVTSDFNL